MSIMESKKTTFYNPKKGTSFISVTTRVTPKGQTYFYDKIKSQYESTGRWW